MQARAARKANLLASSYSWLQTKAVFMCPVRMASMPAKTPHLFCAVDSMPKLFLDVTGKTVGQ
jgi:hypothetical protein